MKRTDSMVSCASPLGETGRMLGIVSTVVDYHSSSTPSPSPSITSKKRSLPRTGLLGSAFVSPDSPIKKLPITILCTVITGFK